MNYENFVSELRSLISEHSQLNNMRLTCEDPGFKKWRHKVSDLIMRVQSRGYVVNCRIDNRNFTRMGGLYNSPNEKEKVSDYNRDLQDTITELETIVDTFDKYGEPNLSGTEPVQKQELEYPKKVTMSWLIKHVPIKLWGSAFLLILIVFGIGVGMGQSKLYNDMMNKLEPKESKSTPNK